MTKTKTDIIKLSFAVNFTNFTKLFGSFPFPNIENC